MLATKAVAAILMTGLGSLAAGTAAYFEANPRALAPMPKPYVPLAPKPLAAAQIHHVKPLPAPEPEVLTIDPVVITSRPQAVQHAIARPPRVGEAPCSEWQDLATGPAGRKVRMLCQH